MSFTSQKGNVDFRLRDVFQSSFPRAESITTFWFVKGLYEPDRRQCPEWPLAPYARVTERIVSNKCFLLFAMAALMRSRRAVYRPGRYNPDRGRVARPFGFALTGRVEDRRADRPLDRATFPLPFTSHQHADFPQCAPSICFTPRLMGPIPLGQLSVRRVALDSC